MKNSELKQTILAFYNRHAYAHLYIMGFRWGGLIYYVIVKAQTLDHLTKLDKASRGAGMALRFKPTKAQKTLMLSLGAEILCSEKFFDELCEMSKYNKGEIFEMLITEKFGQTWEKDNIPFTKAGDIEIDGVAYQIKFEKATFINEAQMMRLSAEV